MNPFAVLFSPHGRLAQRPFTAAVVALYILVFCSQILLGGGVTGTFGFWPFVVLQALLTWVWFALHAKRLRDAGLPIGRAIAIAILYALAMVLLVLVVMLIISAAPPQSSGAGGAEVGTVFRVFVLLGMFALIDTDAALGGFGYVLMGFMVLVMIPVVVAASFSIWAGTRPTGV